MRRNRTLSKTSVKGICPPGRRNVMRLIFLVLSFRRLPACIVSCSSTSDMPRLTLGFERAKFLRCQVLESSHAKSRFRVDVMRSGSNRGVYGMLQRRRRDWEAILRFVYDRLRTRALNACCRLRFIVWDFGDVLSYLLSFTLCRRHVVF